MSKVALPEDELSSGSTARVWRTAWCSPHSSQFACSSLLHRTRRSNV